MRKFFIGREGLVKLFFSIILVMTSFVANGNETVRLELSKADLPSNGEIICQWAEKSAVILMRQRQNGVLKDKVLSKFNQLIERESSYDSWRELAFVLANNLVVSAYESDNVSKSKISETSEDFGVWIYNQCLSGELVGWEFGTIKISTTVRSELNYLNYGLNDVQKQLCEWVRENSVTVMRHSFNGLSKYKVTSSFKRKIKDTEPIGSDLSIHNGLIDFMVDGAYKDKHPYYLRTVISKDYGVSMYNQCVSGKLLVWR